MLQGLCIVDAHPAAARQQLLAWSEHRPTRARPELRAPRSTLDRQGGI